MCLWFHRGDGIIWRRIEFGRRIILRSGDISRGGSRGIIEGVLTGYERAGARTASWVRIGAVVDLIWIEFTG